MLTRVELFCFQAHEYLDLPIGKLTTLVGPSNSGKSAVLRAVAGMLRNDSVGPFVRHGAANLRVVLHLQDGHKVEWEKGKDKNGYVLHRPDGTESKYQKVGTAVPDEVAEVLRMGPITLEDGSKAHVNLHEQADKPFLVFDTPASVAKVFGELTSAGKLFSAANEGNRRNREDKKTKSIRQEDLEQLSVELEAYAGLDAQVESLQAVQEGLVLIERLDAAATELNALLDARSRACADALVIEQREMELADIAQADLDVLVKLDSACNQLTSCVEDLTAVNVRSEGHKAEVERLEAITSIDLSGLEDLDTQVAELKSLVDEHSTARAQQVKLGSVSSTLKGLDEADLSGLDKMTAVAVELDSLLVHLGGKQLLLENELASVKQAEQDLAALAKEIALIDVCPSCGQDLSENAKEHLLHG